MAESPLSRFQSRAEVFYEIDVSVRPRPLGKTGLVVSELALGTWGLSGDGYGPIEEGEAERTIARAVEIGINLIDTADAYGAGKMEALLGKALAAHKDVRVVTKGGTDRTTEPPRKRFDGAHLREAVKRSLKRLGRDRIDLYLLHNPSADAVHLGEATGTLIDLKKEGLIAHWGVSAGDTDVARAAIDKGAEVLELAYNLVHAIDLHRLAGDIMVAGVGVLARSTLAYGLLAGMWAPTREFPENDHRGDRWTRLELERRVSQLDAVRFLVKGDVLTLRGAAVRFALANHLVSSAVLGPRSVIQLEQLVREVGAGPRYLPDEDLAALPRALQKVGILT
jgi:aryl-alcohol dehydrogenase-like predicted oxidoreductase